MRHLIAAMTVLLLLLSGCATGPRLPDDHYSSIASRYIQALSTDDELRATVRRLSTPQINGFGIHESVLQIDGRLWTDMTRAQRKRFMRKAASLLGEEMVREAPGGFGDLNVKVIDDLNVEVGWFFALTSGSWQYRWYGP